MSNRKTTGTRFSGTIDVNHTLCTGCRNCEIACAVEHEGSVFVAASRIRVHQFEDGPIDVPIICHRCSDFPCVAACPPRVGALSIDESTGAIKVDDEKCVGVKCSRCSKACRHRTAIFFHPVTKKPLVCDLCQGDPACVKVCPTRAIELVSGSSFDGIHYAKSSPQEIARSIASGFAPSRSTATTGAPKEVGI